MFDLQNLVENLLLESKTEKEIEYVFFGKPKSFDFMNKYDHKKIEQYEIRTGDEEKKRGITRVRKTGTSDYKMALKLIDVENADPKTKLSKIEENEFEISPEAFYLFSEISTSGFKKERYIVPTTNGLKYEIDVFFDKNGNINDWVKIDLEIPDLSTPVPPLPIEMSTMRTKQMSERSRVEKEEIKKIWSSLMIKG